ncbi:MAG: hypothetical protein RIR48_2690 [Bacteroidota bacterium]
MSQGLLILKVNFVTTNIYWGQFSALNFRSAILKAKWYNSIQFNH